MIAFESFSVYQSQRHKLAWVDTRNRDLTSIEAFLIQNGFPVLDIGKFVAAALALKNADDYPNLDIPEMLARKVKMDSRIPDGWNQAALCLLNPGILLEPDLKLHPGSLLKDISKNTFLILLWDYLCDDPGFFHWGDQKQIFHLDFSDTGIKKIPFTDEI